MNRAKWADRSFHFYCTTTRAICSFRKSDSLFLKERVAQKTKDRFPNPERLTPYSCGSRFCQTPTFFVPYSYPNKKGPLSRCDPAWNDLVNFRTKMLIGSPPGPGSGSATLPLVVIKHIVYLSEKYCEVHKHEQVAGQGRFTRKIKFQSQRFKFKLTLAQAETRAILYIKSVQVREFCVWELRPLPYPSISVIRFFTIQNLG